MNEVVESLPAASAGAPPSPADGHDAFSAALALLTAASDPKAIATRLEQLRKATEKFVAERAAAAIEKAEAAAAKTEAATATEAVRQRETKLKLERIAFDKTRDHVAEAMVRYRTLDAPPALFPGQAETGRSSRFPAARV